MVSTFKRNYNVEMAARNLALNLGLYPPAIKQWDPGLWRGPRILVPITVQALVVESAENGPWADMRFVPESIPGYKDAAENGEGENDEDDLPEQPGPFDIYENRPPGVYLHWALPDALTKGTLGEPTEEVPPTEADFGTPPQPEPLQEEEAEFPLIPDRWLVVRMYNISSDKRRRVQAWVIESEEEDPAKTVTPWTQWTENRDDMPENRWLTALGSGDPAYAAYYDNVENVLGFYDAAEDVEEGPLTYLVIGWYARPEDDPLFAPGNQNAFSALLKDLGWSVGDDNARIQQAAEDAHDRLNKIGLSAKVSTVAAHAISTVDDDQIFLASQLKQLAPPTPAETLMGPAAVQPPISSGLVGQTIQAQFELSPAIMEIAASASEAVLGKAIPFKKYWPRQMLCHGTVYDVRWQGGGGSYDTADSGKPDTGSVRVAVGNTGLEALSAVLAQQTDKANAERMLTAFHYGLLSTLQDPDGPAALESLLHSEDFQSKPGGFVVDMIEQGDYFPQQKPGRTYLNTTVQAAAQPVTQQLKPNIVQQPLYHLDSDIKTKPAFDDGTGRFGVNLEYARATLDAKVGALSDLYDDLLYDPDIKKNVYNPTPREKVAVRRAMPRFWEPKDPVLLLVQAHRSYKHGEDGRFNADERLNCRVTGETVSTVEPEYRLPGSSQTIKIAVKGTDLSWVHIQTGQLPPEVTDLFREALLLDTSNAERASEVIGQRASAQGVSPIIVGPDGLPVPVTWPFLFQITKYWNKVLNDELDEQTMTAISNEIGMFPSIIAMQPWRKPWTPLHLDWEVEWYPSLNGERDWTLEENEYEFTGEDTGTDGEAFASYTGRTLLTPSIANIMTSRLADFLSDEDKGIADLATASQEKALKALMTALKDMDVLTTSMDGFHDALMGIEEKHQFSVVDGSVPTVEETAQPIEDSPLYPMRAGHFRFKRLRVVDAFGQFYDVDAEGLNEPVRAGDVSDPENADLVRLPPRIVQPARAMFRMLSATTDADEATKLRTPVCGWILPDHLDEALEVYDNRGINQGQVQLAPNERTVEWQGVPGQPGPLGAPPSLENTHLTGFVKGLLTWGVQDTKDAEESESPRKESALSALLRMIDATLWTVDPVGREGDEHLSVLVGRPLALVRAELRLETENLPLTDELQRTAFPFRIGAVTRLQDGLMGYFVNDDYTQFYPVHETIAQQTRATGPRKGFLGPANKVQDYYFNDFPDSEKIDPVDHPYINTEPVLYLRPGQKIMLTLVVDPRGGVHVTSGLLPRKRIDLMRDHVADALDAMSVTFRIGPVLSDPETIRMPLPSEIRGGWSWVRRTGATVWAEDPIVNATDDALLPDTPAEITEGWLKLSSALGETEEENGG